MVLVNNFSIKILDFGFGTKIRDEKDQPIYSDEILGTPGYLAPEIELGNYQGEKVDTFALGVILFLLCFKRYPFNPEDQKKYYQDYLKDKDAFWNDVENVDPDLRELLDLIFEANASHRIDINGILVHKWLKKAENATAI